MQFVQSLNLVSYLENERVDTELDSAMFHSKENICELHMDGTCLTAHGIYFGTRDEREPKFCPKHYFSGHTGYTIEPTFPHSHAVSMGNHA